MKSKTRITRLRLQSIVLFSLLLAAAFPAVGQTQKPTENVVESGETALNTSAENRRRGDLVSIISPKARSRIETAPVQLTVRLGKGVRPADFFARLNGQEITGKFTSKSVCFISKCDLTASVIPADGLIKGRNELSVEVIGRGFARDHASRAFFITGPKSDAGSDVREKIGRAVQLDGSKSSSGTGLSLNYQWRLVSQPAGSQALLSDPSSPRPGFVPDLNGAYTAELIVNDGYFDSEPDTVNVSATPADTLVPVETLHDAGQNQYGIKVGDEFYSNSAEMSGTGLQILVLDRKTLNPKLSVFRAFAGGDNPAQNIGQFLDENAHDNSKIVIISALKRGTGFDNSAIAQSLEAFGATQEFRDNHASNFVYSFIGIRGLKPGQAYQIVGANPSLSGYFVPDSSTNYTFIQPDYVKYEITTSVNPATATINLCASLSCRTSADQTFNSGPLPGGATGGFFVVVLDRQTLFQVKSGLFGTNGGNDPGSDQQVMLGVLQQYAGQEGYLVFIASLGQPLSGQTQWIQDLAQVIGRTSATNGPDLSGTYATFAQLGNPPDVPIAPFTYAFLGSGSPTPALNLSRFNSQELLSLDASQNAQISGILARGRRNAWYAPMNSDTTGSANLGFYLILAQKPVPWPYPNPDSDGEKNAYIFISRYVTQTLGKTATIDDVRVDYSDGTPDTWLTRLQSDLGNPPNPNIKPDNDIGTFTAGDYSNVYNQLSIEFPYLAKIQKFNTQLSGLLSDTALTQKSIQENVYDKVKNAIKSEDASPVTLFLENLFGFFLNIGAAVGGETAPVFGVTGAMFSWTTSLLNRSDGNSNSQFDAEAQQLSDDLANNFAAQKTALGTMFDSIYEDWGKFSALAPLLDDKANHPDWYWDQATTEGQMINSLSTSIEASFYQSLLPTKLGVVEMFNVSDPGKWCSTTVFYICTYPYDNWPTEGWLATIGPPGNSQSVRFLAGNVDTDQPGGKPNPSVLDHLYGKVSDGGLGFSKIDLLYRWPLKFGTCDPTHTHQGVCSWPK